MIPYILTAMLLLSNLYSKEFIQQQVVQQRLPQLPDILIKEKKEEVKKDKKLTFNRQGPTIQMAILLDTSGSMSGLINQAKEQLWKIVNEVTKANKNNKDVVIEVGLFEYGKSSLPYYEGYLQMLSPLTDDLDTVSDELFRLRTNGGEEYAGKVILEAVHRLAWSNHKDDLKLIIIAGNETFRQGNVPYEKAIKKARDNNIIVNTIFCGNRREGIRLDWKDGATLGGGKYFNINHNERRVYIPSPYDDEILLLGEQLNSTYLYYGTKNFRRNKSINMYRQDKYSLNTSKGSSLERSLVKSKKQYASKKVDMVSAYKYKKEAIKEIEEDELPEELQGKSQKEIEKIVKEKKEKREEIQNKISTLEKKREKFLNKQRVKNSKNLGFAITNAIREEALKKGFYFKK